MPRRRLYTPAEANAALPLVAPHVARMRAGAQAAAEALPLTRSFSERADESGGAQPDLAERGAQESLAQARREVVEAMRALEEMGVEVKDIERGLLDFPWERDGEIVELCWLDGEPEVAYWHRIGEGFAGRKPL